MEEKKTLVKKLTSQIAFWYRIMIDLLYLEGKRQGLCKDFRTPSPNLVWTTDGGSEGQTIPPTSPLTKY